MKPGQLQRTGIAVLWALAFVTALFAARYFFFSSETLARFEDSAAQMTSRWAGTAPIPALHPFSRQPLLLLLHVGGGIAATLFGLFQFLPGLRHSRLKLHRAMGMVYAIAVVGSGITGFPLSFLFYTATDAAVRGRLIPAGAGFALLSIVWPCVTLLAVKRAQQRRFIEHRAWMLRSYSLTAAGISTRVLALPLLMITRNPILATNLVILAWPLNLLLAEMLIRRSASATKHRRQCENEFFQHDVSFACEQRLAKIFPID